MKNDKLNYFLCLLFFTVLAFITFRCCWGADMVFSASDLNIGSLASSKNTYPEGLVGYFTANTLLGSSRSGIMLVKIILAVMPLTLFANTFYGLFLVLSSMSMVWFLRMWNRSWAASVVGALVAFWVNSIMLAVGGHAFKQEVLAFSVLALGLVEKAIRTTKTGRAVGYSLLAGLAVGIMMVEQQDVALLAGLFVGSYTLFRLVQVHGRAVMRWAAVLVPVGAVALLLAGGTMLKSYEHNIVKASSVQGETEDKWNFITQWSLVPREWPDLIATGWGGWSSNNPKGPYWGKLGQSAEWPDTGQGFRNFKLTSNYIGIIPFLLGAFGLVAAIRNRKDEEGTAMLFWSVAGIVGFWLAFGKYSLLYKLFYHLPLVGNIRAPIKLLDNFQICLGIVAAYGLDRLLIAGKGGKSAKVLWISGSVFGGLMLLAGLKLQAFPAAQQAAFSKMGFESYAETMVDNMANAWLHGALLAFLCAGLVFVVWKGYKPARRVALLVIALLAADSLVLTSHYFHATDITIMKKGNAVVNYIKANQGDERAIFMDQSGIYNQWIGSDARYHGLNLFNIWQMPRMPSDYKEFLGTVGRNQVRLWELSAIKYIAAPSSVMQQFSKNPELGKMFTPVLNYKVPTPQGMRDDVLLEFNRAIPRFALYQGWRSVPNGQQCSILASSGHNPQTGVLLDSSAGVPDQDVVSEFSSLKGAVTKRKATLNVQAEKPSIVRFSQHYQPGWTVYVDGEPAELLRVDYLCMGVLVPEGQHLVEFRCISGVTEAARMGLVFLVSIAASIWLFHRKSVKGSS